MNKATLHEVAQWTVKAEYDLQSTILLLSAQTPIHDTGVYHCQQAAEKILKAYLTSKDTLFSKMHDLRVLLLLCQSLDKRFEYLSDTADILTPYAIAFCYPSDVLEPSHDEANEAISLTQEMMRFVMEKINHVL